MSKLMKSSDTVVLAIDAGGTYFKSALINCEGEIFDDSFHQTLVSSQGTKARIIMAYEQIICQALDNAQAHEMNLCGIGISTPGPFDYKRGMSLMEHKFQAIKGVSLSNELYALGIFPDKLPVVFMHDVHAFLKGEHWTGALQGIDNAAAITLGTGLGFGIMKDVKILDNGKGGPCISIFNRAYKDGILEDIASRRGIIARYWQYTGNKDTDIDVSDIAEAARKKDVKAIKVFQETGEILAGELMEILVFHDIKSLVFGGQISKSFDLFGPTFQEKLFALGRETQALPGRNIEFSSLKGVAWAAFCQHFIY